MISAARLLRLGTALTVASTVAALAAGIAARPAAAAATCSASAEHPFLRGTDPAAYTLAPGGAFEGSTSSWKLAGGARVIARQRAVQGASVD